MPSFNKTIVVGHLCRDPQLKYLPNEMAVAESSIAVNHKFKTKSGEQREDVLFLDWSAFGKTGEIINQYAKKGDAILLEGRLKMDVWEDKNGGGKRTKISLVVDQFQFLGGKPDGDRDEQPAPRQQQRLAPASVGAGVRQKIADKPTPQQPFGDEEVFRDSDIPF